MSHAKQCPSTIGKQAVPDARRPRDFSAATGRAYWRSLDDLADTREFRDFLEREFPAHASELSDASRRQFLKVMGASLALAGAATIPGCRRPDHTIITYGQRPEDIIHGKALFYATAMPLPGGGAEGLLIETHDGRPTKIEGNPLHPVNQGKTSLRAQTAILEMYDPDRLREPSRIEGGERVNATWEEFDRFAAQHFERYNATNGRGLAILVDKKSSPSRDALRDRIQAKWPLAMWLPYEAIENDQERIGLTSALGGPHRAHRSFDKAQRILSIADDFLGGESADLRDQRAFAASRRVLTTSGPQSEMSRLYVIESQMSATGGAADHRLRLKPSAVTFAGVAAMAAILRRVGGSNNVNLANAADAWIRRSTESGEGYTPPPREWLDAMVNDLAASPGAALITVGPSQPALVHALAVAANRALGGEGATVAYTPVTGDAAASSVSSIRALSSAIEAGGVQTLVSIGCNPVFDAPADLNMAALFSRVATTITLSVDNNETAAGATWRLPGAHFLEAWDDVTALDATHSVVQPMIAPLFGGRSELELLARISGQERTDGYEIVRETWRTGPLAGDGDFDKAWRRVLHNGLHPAAAPSRATPSLRADAITEALDQPAPVQAGMEVLFIACPKVRDGRHANNGWLQEIPDPITKVTWDNPALVSPATARRLGMVDTQDGIGEQSAPVAVLTLGGRTIEVPIWRSPGVADDTIVLTLGYGREVCGHVGTGAGVNTYSVRTTSALRTASGATLERARGRGAYPIASAQNHHSIEGRTSILREVDVQAWRAHGDVIDDSYDAYYNKRNLKFGERLGELAHVPVNRDIYRPDQIHEFTTRPQWGMSIDLATCIGCAACTAACQAENNIPVVGKTEVNKGREMHWIRVDRYYSGDADADVDMTLQPVTCMHCEAAPCETVCPVNATVHGPEGTNDMAYNRCIGTRYCSNNCPYKVRRFNFFDYATKKLHGEYVGKSVVGGVVDNAHLVPPRLREKIGELEKLKFNPNVTVRERGVMEKCTYCIQRVNEARIETKLQKLDNIPDGFFKVACEQACPTEAIVFGDILDPESRVHKMREHARTYAMLGYLNVRPRTTYMVGLRNPNPAIREPRTDLFHGHEENTDDHGPAHSAAPPAPGEERRVRLPVLDAGAIAIASGGAR